MSTYRAEALALAPPPPPPSPPLSETRCAAPSIPVQDLDKRRRNALLQWGALMAVLLAVLVNFFYR